MDRSTGRLYANMREAQEALRAQGVSEEEIKRRLHPVDRRKMRIARRLDLVTRLPFNKNERRKMRRKAKGA